MQTTEKFGLPVPEPDDLYDIAVYAQALAILDALAPLCTGISHITALTKAAYDALDPPDPSTIYLVTQTDGSVKMYLGTVPLSGGGGGGGTDPDAVHSDDVSTLRVMTQAAYDALTTKDVDTIYFLT